MRYLIALTAASSMFAASQARADIVCEWMDFAAKTQAAAPSTQQPVFLTGEHERAASQVALAMFEALNAIDRRYESYLGLPRAAAGASPDAAAATAAYQVLISHYPALKSSIDESYSMAMDGIADAAAREAGRKLGAEAAAAALKAGTMDPALPAIPYQPQAPVGVWVPTQLPVFAPTYLTLKPWVIGKADAVRPGPPPALTSERYARDFDEVKRVGGKNSSIRTPHQTLMARYRITPDMMPALRMIADQKDRRLVDNARMFALYHMVSDDALLAIVDAKQHYNFWRPITAIRNAEKDGNAETVPEPGWEPLIQTPNHPEYPCGHCIGAGAIAELMKLEYGNRPAWGVRVASRSIPNAAVQVLPDWDKWAEEVSWSRTLGGVHYRFSNEAGDEMGRKIARMAVAKVMRPIP
jgi:hypothetical protein